jgi:uroporphyrinogen decarboxylase
MNSVERVVIALKNEQPDRVPVVEFLIDPKVMSKAVPGAKDMADGMDKLDMDGVGCGAVFHKVKDLDEHTWVDEWGVIYKKSDEIVDHPLHGPITGIADLKNYQPPDPNADGRLGKLPDLVKRYKGKRAIIFHQRAAFMWAAYLNGLDNLLMNMLAEPDFAEALMDMVLDVNLQIARRAVAAGADVIVLGDDYAYNGGLMMSPAVFRAMILPRLTKMIHAIHEAGGLCIKHSDGNVYSILEDMVAAGMDGFNPIEPVAGMELAEVKRRIGDRVALVGNIDCAHLLPHGSTSDVREAVRQAIADAGNGGGYIVSSSNSIHSSCKAENLRAMVEAVHEFGRYPIAV